MSEALILLRELHEQGKTVRVEGPTIRIKPPVTDPVLLDRLRSRKDELMALLAGPGGDLAVLDAERYSRDAAIPRGYDVDRNAPSHPEFLERLKRFGFQILSQVERPR
jgi:hypothetical protein